MIFPLNIGFSIKNHSENTLIQANNSKIFRAIS